MPTTKRRIPVTLPPDLESFLEDFAEMHGVSLSQAITLLVRYGLDMAEDDFFGMLADELDGNVAHWKGHNQFWSEVLAS